MSLTFHFEPEKLVWFAIPKVATTSIRGLLLPLVSTKPIEQVKDLIYDVNWPSITRREFVHNVQSTHLSFAVVRNPWKRMISAYQDKICRDKLYPHIADQGFKPWMPFMDFVDHVASLEDKAVDVHFRSQWSFIFSDNRGLLPNVILRVEEIEKLPPIVNSWCGGTKNLVLGTEKRNVSKKTVKMASIFDTAGQREHFERTVAKRFGDEIDFFRFRYPFKGKKAA